MNNSDWLLVGGVFLVPRGCVVSHLGGVCSRSLYIYELGLACAKLGSRQSGECLGEIFSEKLCAVCINVGSLLIDVSSCF